MLYDMIHVNCNMLVLPYICKYIALFCRGGMVRDGTGRDGTGRCGTGRYGTGRYGTGRCGTG